MCIRVKGVPSGRKSDTDAFGYWLGAVGFERQWPDEPIAWHRRLGGYALNPISHDKVLKGIAGNLLAGLLGFVSGQVLLRNA